MSFSISIWMAAISLWKATSLVWHGLLPGNPSWEFPNTSCLHGAGIGIEETFQGLRLRWKDPSCLSKMCAWHCCFIVVRKLPQFHDFSKMIGEIHYFSKKTEFRTKMDMRNWVKPKFKCYRSKILKASVGRENIHKIIYITFMEVSIWRLLV